jgi:hypothetical protein
MAFTPYSDAKLKFPTNDARGGLTARVTGDGAGVGNVEEQKKLEAGKMPVKPHRAPPSSARIVSWPLR